MTRTTRTAGFTLIELLIVMCLIGLLLAIMLPNFARARARSEYAACASNLKNIGTAFEMYATDNNGTYPNRARLVVPRYIAAFPTCPAAGVPNYNVVTAAYPDAFTVVCLGGQHAMAGIAINYPQYVSGQGLIAP